MCDYFSSKQTVFKHFKNSNERQVILMSQNWQTFHTGNWNFDVRKETIKLYSKTLKTFVENQSN